MCVFQRLRSLNGWPRAASGVPGPTCKVMVVSFDLAKTVFKDPFAVKCFDDREDHGEERFVIIGMAEGRVVRARDDHDQTREAQRAREQPPWCGPLCGRGRQSGATTRSGPGHHDARTRDANRCRPKPVPGRGR